MRYPYLFALLLIGCNTAPPPANTVAIAPDPKTAIKSIEVVTQGGQMGYYASCKITKDSVVHTSGRAMDSTRNTAGARATSPSEWQLLTESINLTEFKEAKDGESFLPVDGTDTKVILTTELGEISKTNAAGNAIWTGIEMWSGKNCR